MNALKGKITLNTEGFKKGMASVKAQAGRLKKEVKAKFAGAGKAISYGIAGGVAVGAAVTAAAAKKILDSGDKIHKMGLKTGFTAETLSQLSHAADLSGTSIDGIDKSIASMQRNILTANDGSKMMVDSFGALGLTVKDLQGLNPEEQFKLISDRLADIDDPSTKAALAMRIFGKSGRDLLPMLADGSQGLQDMKDDADKLGVTMSQKQVNNIAAFNDSVDRMGKGIMGLFQSALGFDDMRTMIDKVTATVINFRNSAEFTSTVKNIKGLASDTIAAGHGIFNVITKTGKNFFKLAAMIGGAGAAAMIAVKTGLTIPLIKALAVAYTAIGSISIGEALAKSIDLSSIFAQWITRFDGFVSLAPKYLKRLYDAFKGNDTSAITAEIDKITDEVEQKIAYNKPETKNFFEELKKSFSKNNADFMNFVSQKLGGVDNVPQTIKDIIEEYKKGVGDFEKITGAGGGAADPEKTAIGQQVVQAKKLKKELAGAGRQVSFIVDLDKLNSQKKNTASSNFRNRGQKFRDRFQEVSEETRGRFNDVNNRNRQLSNTQSEFGNGLNRSLGGSFSRNLNPGGQGGQSIADSINSQSNTMSQLVGLAKVRNNILTDIKGLLGNETGGFAL